MVEHRTPLITAATAAKLFNLTPRRIQQLAKDGVIPKSDRGKYELIRIVPAYVKYLQDRAVGRDLSPTDYHTEKTRLTRAQAEKAELESAALRGRLVKIEDVSRNWTEMIAAARAKLLALPQRIAQVAVGGSSIREVEESARKEIYDALRELGGGAQPGGEGVDSPAAPDDSAVGRGKKGAQSRGKRGARKVAKPKGATHRRTDGGAKP